MTLGRKVEHDQGKSSLKFGLDLGNILYIHQDRLVKDIICQHAEETDLKTNLSQLTVAC